LIVIAVPPSVTRSASKQKRVHQINAPTSCRMHWMSRGRTSSTGYSPARGVRTCATTSPTGSLHP
jgi:hypothetical protein